jgi:hypothetical protein
MITIRATTQADVQQLCASIRPKDEIEVIAVKGQCSPHLLWQSMRGDSRVALDEKGHVICIFGCTPIERMEGAAAPWMLGTVRLEKHLYSMCKHARKYVREWHAQYPLLTNATLIDNDVVITWLRWLGFKFTHAFETDSGVQFIQFSKIKAPVCVNPQPSCLQ